LDLRNITYYKNSAYADQNNHLRYPSTWRKWISAQVQQLLDTLLESVARRDEQRRASILTKWNNEISVCKEAILTRSYAYHWIPIRRVICVQMRVGRVEDVVDLVRKVTTLHAVKQGIEGILKHHELQE